MDKITDPEVKYLVFLYQKEIKETTLCKRRSKFEAEDNFDSENMERDERKEGTTASYLALQSKEKGKDVIETYGSDQFSQ